MFFNKLLKPAVLTIACAAALTAGSFGNVSFFHEAHAQTSQLSGLPDFTKLVEDNGKAVVSISTVKKAKRLGPQNGVPDEQLEMLRRFGFPFPFGDFNGPGMTPERRGQGSGFIIDPNGIILTNNHVVDGADEVTVHLTDKREFKAKVIGTDPKTDIAVIKIEGKNLPVVKLGKSDDENGWPLSAPPSGWTIRSPRGLFPLKAVTFPTNSSFRSSRPTLPSTPVTPAVRSST